MTPVKLLARRQVAKVVLQARRRFAPGNFVIFHIGRSGSRLLSDMLNQHPAIRSDGELFRGHYRLTPELAAAGKRLREPCDMLDEIRRRMPRAGFSRYYGFEVKFFHIRCNGMTVPAFLQGVEQLGFSKFIVLERRNYLRKIVSSLVAYKKGQGYHISAAERAALVQIELDVNCVEIDSDSKPLLDYLRDYRDNLARLKRLLERRRFLWLSYEDDLQQDPTQGARRVCEFLQLPPHQPKVTQGKTTPYPLRQVVRNYDDVAAALQGTEFEWMLDA